MKTYNQLNESEKKRAIDICLAGVVASAIGGTLEPPRELGIQIECIITRASINETPWFAGEMILEDKKIERELSKLALSIALKTLCPNFDEDIPNYIRL